MVQNHTIPQIVMMKLFYHVLYTWDWMNNWCNKIAEELLEHGF